MADVVFEWHSAGRFECLLSDRADFKGAWRSEPERFSTIVILDLLSNDAVPARFVKELARSVERSITSDDQIHFYEDRHRLPADADCTALGATALFRAGAIDGSRFERLGERLINNVGPDGIIQVYFPPCPGRDNLVDPVVAVNALYAANLAGVTGRATATEGMVQQVLENGARAFSSRYYVSPDTFLLFASRLVRDFPDAYDHWTGLVRDRVRERSQVPGTVLELAQRVIAAGYLGIGTESNLTALLGLSMTRHWPPAAFFRFGRRRIYFGSRALTSAFVACALRPQHHSPYVAVPTGLRNIQRG